jgi:subtilisin family serine protease
VGQPGFFSSNPFFGTSAAAPHVAAIAALLWSFKPALTSGQVVQTLTQPAVDLGAPGFDITFGFGRVGAILALSNSVAVTTLTSLSTRGLVQTGDQVLIGGFIIEGTIAQTVLVRADGPSLTGFGVQGALIDPVLRLFSGPTLIAQNDARQVPEPLCASPIQTRLCSSTARLS